MYLVVFRGDLSEGSDATRRMQDANERLPTLFGLPKDRFGGGDIHCDRGAAEAVGLSLDEPAGTVAVYFNTERDARRFAARLRPPPAGVARVKTYCLD